MKIQKLLPLAALLSALLAACGTPASSSSSSIKSESSSSPTSATSSKEETSSSISESSSEAPTSQSTSESSSEAPTSQSSSESSSESSIESSSESSSIDYGTLTIADISVDFLGTATINPVFSKPEMAEDLTYDFTGANISINGTTVKGLVGGSETTVTAWSDNFLAEFKVTVGAAPIGYLPDRDFTFEDSFSTAKKVGVAGDYIYKSKITINATANNPHVTINFTQGNGNDRFLIWDNDNNNTFDYVWMAKAQGGTFTWSESNKSVDITLYVRGNDLFMFANDALQLTSLGYLSGYAELEIGTESMAGSFTNNRLYTVENNPTEFQKYDAMIAKTAIMTTTNAAGGAIKNGDFITETETTTQIVTGNNTRNVVMLNGKKSYTEKGDFMFGAHVKMNKVGSWFGLNASRSGIVNEWGNYHLFLQNNRIHSSYGSLAASPLAKGIDLNSFADTEFDIVMMRKDTKLYLCYETDDGIAASITSGITTDEMHVWFTIEEGNVTLSSMKWGNATEIAEKANAIEEALKDDDFGKIADFTTSVDNGWDVREAQGASGNFVLDANIAVTGIGTNPHFTFDFNKNDTNRFLLWGNKLGQGDNDLYVETLAGLVWNKVIDKVALDGDNCATFSISIISYNGEGHMLINGEYAATIYSIGTIGSFEFGAANIAASWTNVRLYNEEHKGDGNVYDARIKAIGGLADCAMDTTEEAFGKYYLPATGKTFVAKMDIELTQALANNGHISFNLNGSDATRFLLWNNGQTNGYYYGDYGYVNTDKFVDATSGSASFELAILVTGGKAYMFVDDVVYATCDSAPAVSHLSFGKGGACAVAFKNISACDSIRNPETYNHYLDLLK